MPILTPPPRCKHVNQVLMEDMVVVLHGEDFDYGIGSYERCVCVVVPISIEDRPSTTRKPA